MGQILLLNKRFINKLKEDEQWIQTLNLYGYKDYDDFLQKVILKLNNNYKNVLNISSYGEMPEEKESEYFMYNGYISGDIGFYDEISVSFSTIVGKEGNTLISQEVMPFIRRKLEGDRSFLFNEKKKKIFLLTTYKSEVIDDVNRNTIRDQSSSTFQMLVKCLNTLNFDVISIFPVFNLSTDSRYNSIDELIDNLNYLTAKSSSNDQTQNICIKDNIVYGDIKEDSKGQDYKYFALRFLTALMLNQGYKYNINSVLNKTADAQIKTLQDYVLFVNENDIQLSNSYFYEDNMTADEVTYEVDDKDLNDYKKAPITSEGNRGRKFYTKKRVKDEKIKFRSYLCDCDDNRHLYFISMQTKQNYIEGHHIIPINQQNMYWDQYNVNLDVIQNISPLCPHCHRKIHNGTVEEKLDVLKRVYEKNETGLKEIDPQISIGKLAEYYNIFK